MKKSFKKLFMMLVLVITVMCSMAVVAHAEEYGGVAKGTKWSVNTTTGVLKIDVEGPMGSWAQGAQPWYKYRADIRSIEFLTGTTKITNYAFSDLVNLSIIEIPSCVEEIGSYAYVNCQSATEIYIPISVATWGGFCFEGCTSVGYIYTENKANIEQTLPVWDKTVGSNAAGKTVELQIESKAIGQYAFFGLSTVTEVKLPTTLTSINAYAFYGFTSPFALNLGSATAIGEYAFYGCTGVTSINLPSATTIGQYAFYGCTGAAAINLPKVTTIGESAFENCTTAKTITATVPTCTFGKNAFKNCTGCTDMFLGSITFPVGGTVLEGVGKTKGFSLTIGKDITNLTDQLKPTLIGTTGNLTIKLEAGSLLDTIGTAAFENNLTLVGVDLSNRTDTLTIGERAFSKCTNITTFSTNTGKTDYKTLSLGSLVNLEQFNYNTSECINWFKEWTGNTVYRTYEGTSSLYEGSQRGSAHAFYKMGRAVTAGTTLKIGASVKVIYENEFASDVLFYRLYNFYYGGSNWGTWNYTNNNGGYQRSAADLTSENPSYSPLCLIGKVYAEKGSQLTTIEPMAFVSLRNHAADKKVQVTQDYTDSVVFTAQNIMGTVQSYGGSSAYSSGWTTSSENGIKYYASATYSNYLYYNNSSEYQAKYYKDGRLYGSFYGINSGSSGLYVEMPYDRGQFKYTDSKLTDVDLSACSQLTTIGFGAFHGCYNLTKAILPKSVTAVGCFAFNTGNPATSIQMRGKGAINEFTACKTGVDNSSSNQMYYRGQSVYQSTLEGVQGSIIQQVDVGASATAYLLDKKLTGTASDVLLAGTGTTDSYAGKAVFTSPINQVETLEVQPGITTIGDNLFANYPMLKNLNWHNALTSIGATAFSGDTAITQATLPSSLTTIGNKAFAGTSLKTIEIPALVTTLGSKIFDGCSQLASIKYNATAAKNVAPTTQPFSGVSTAPDFRIAIGNAVTALPDYLFYQCPATSVSVGTSVATIGVGALGGMPKAVLACDIANAAFSLNAKDGNLYTKDGLTLVSYLASRPDDYYSLPLSVKKVGAGAFYGAPNLTNVSFDATITDIGNYAFAATPKLTSIAISDFMDKESFDAEVKTDKTTWFGNAAVVFSGLKWDIGVTKGAMTATLYSDGTLAISGTGPMKNWASAASVDWYAKRGSILKVTFEGAPTSIGAYAFHEAINLVDIKIPQSVTSIGQYAFYNCTSLPSVTIPDAVTKINTYTFANCEKLKWVDCGLGLETIEPFAFTGCVQMRYLCLNGTVKEIKANAFTNDKNLTILVAGKQQASDFSVYEGLPTAKADVFRICYMPDITNGRIITRYKGNAATDMNTGYTSESDLWAYALDSNKDGKADYLHIAGGSAMEPQWKSVTDVPWDAIRADITKVVIEDDVSSVGAYAFKNCTKLEYVKIGKQCSTFNAQAFNGCSALKKLVCDVRMFSVGAITAESQIFVGAGDPSGFAVIFADDVENIPSYLFYNCANLSNLTIGKNVSAIYAHAFSGCTGLKTMYLQGSRISSTDSNVFTNAGSKSGGFTVEIASNVTLLPGGLFYSETSNPYVTSVFVDAGSKLEAIGANAFSGCNRLESANFANCTLLKNINNTAFANCTRLVTMDLSNCTELYSIGAEAFKMCMNLATLDISNDEKLHDIGNQAFSGCTAVRSIVLPASMVTVEDRGFGEWTKDQFIYVLGKVSGGEFKNTPSSWRGNATVIYSSLSWDMSTAEAPKSVMAYYCDKGGDSVAKEVAIFVVGKGAMKDFASEKGLNWPGMGAATDVRTNVTRISIADGITRIGNYNFAGFLNANTLTIGGDIKEVGLSAFEGDKLIPEVDLSGAASNLTMIENNAFKGCSGVSTINLSGCDRLASIGNDAFNNLAGSSVVYVSSDALYDMLANVNGNIKSTYGTTANTRVVTVKVFFTKNLASQGIMAGTQVVWHVEATCNDNLSFTWYYATSQGGQWTEITSAISGYSVVSSTKESTLTMDPTIATLDKNGYYFYCEATSPYYTESSNKVALAVYSAAITPDITVIDKNGDSLVSNTWTQGPLTIRIAAGTASNGVVPTYQYKLKASGNWRNAEPVMTYNTEGIVTFFCRAIINGDSNTASAPVKYIIKVDNSTPTVGISANPEFESTDSVTLTATGTDNVSGVQGISWYKTAADASDTNVNTKVTGYVPLLAGVDMNTMILSVRHFAKVNDSLSVSTTTSTYIGKDVTFKATPSAPVAPGAEADTIANVNAADKAVTQGDIANYELYEIHVMGKDNADFGISASNKGIVSIPVPTTYDTNRLAVYAYNKAGILTPITNFTLNSARDNVTFPVSAFGQVLVAVKPAIKAPVTTPGVTP